jgi:hypothetical protein
MVVQQIGRDHHHPSKKIVGLAYPDEPVPTKNGLFFVAFGQ